MALVMVQQLQVLRAEQEVLLIFGLMVKIQQMSQDLLQEALV